jgi:ankyrin repeat protein
VQLLLDSGATAVIDSVANRVCSNCAQCCSAQTALMMCTTVDTMKVLLAASADVNVTTVAGDTCLHAAARHELPVPVICLLIKAGVDLHVVNNRGQTATQIAHDKGSTLIEQLLNRAAAQQQKQ